MGHIQMIRITILSTLLILALTSCIESKQPVGDAVPRGFARPIYDGDLKKLEPVEQYQVYNKLLTTLYKGDTVQNFFDVKSGFTNPQRRNNGNVIEQVRDRLHNNDVSSADYNSLLLSKHNIDITIDKPYTQAYALANLQEMPLSRTFYHHWIAYQLTNNILFSPGLELDSVFREDAHTIYMRLVQGMNDGKSISDLVYEHMISQENWRRFRSPEDNTREMMEIYLLRFNDAEVPLASTACKNWYLDVNDRYALKYDGAEPNTAPQIGLLDGDGIISCEDFYRAIARHPTLVPAVMSRIIDHFFYGYSYEFKGAFINSAMAAGITHFDELFDAIVFSYEYLTKVTRTQSFEESFLGGAGRLNWYSQRGFFQGKTTSDPGASAPSLTQMNQPAMSNKLGRPWKIPFDSLSLAFYHKSVRDELLMDYRNVGGSIYDRGWDITLVENAEVNNLSQNDFIHYLMLSTVMRKATDTELSTFSSLFTSEGITRRRDQALAVFDYASRLAEFYNMRKFAEVGSNGY